MNENNEWIYLDNGSKRHRTSIIYDNVIIGLDCIIGEYVIIGRDNLDEYKSKKQEKLPMSTIIGDGCVIDAFSYISMGVILGKNVRLGQYSFVGRFSKIGNNTKCHYGAQIYQNVNIGNNCRIGGYCCNNVSIGDDTNMYGSLIHKFLKRNDPYKRAPSIGNGVTISVGSIVIDGVIVGDNAYIAANAVITKDVPPGGKIRNVNDVFEPKNL